MIYDNFLHIKSIKSNLRKAENDIAWNVFLNWVLRCAK